MNFPIDRGTLQTSLPGEEQPESKPTQTPVIPNSNKKKNANAESLDQLDLF